MSTNNQTIDSVITQRSDDVCKLTQDLVKVLNKAFKDIDFKVVHPQKNSFVAISSDTNDYAIQLLLFNLPEQKKFPNVCGVYVKSDELKTYEFGTRCVDVIPVIKSSMKVIYDHSSLPICLTAISRLDDIIKDLKKLDKKWEPILAVTEKFLNEFEDTRHDRRLQFDTNYTPVAQIV